MKKEHLILIWIFLLFSAFSSCRPTKRQDTTSINRKAYEHLLEQSKGDLFWNKVHAFEFLCLNGNMSPVKELLKKDQLKYESSPKERIGYWRCCFHAFPTEEDYYLNRILAVYCNPESPDKIHAAESLAKLNYSFRKIPLASDKDTTTNLTLQAYNEWGKVLPLTSAEDLDYDLFFSVINSKNEVKRRVMAYGSRFMGVFSEQKWEQLAKVALNEPLDSPCAIYLLHGALACCPEAYKQHVYIDSIKKHIQELTYTENKSNQYEGYIALGDWGSEANLALVSKAFNSSLSSNSSITIEDQQDIKSATAYAILKLNTEKEKEIFSFLDWLIVILFLAIIIWIGYNFSLKNKTTNDYVLGGGKMNSGMIGISLFATLLSTLSYLAYPGEMIKYGPVVFTGLLAFPVANWIVGYFIIPRIMSMKVKSAYEILEIKLGKETRYLATFFFLSLRFLWMSTIVYATVDTALIPILGLSKSMVPLISLILILITVFYTTMGGMKAVVITDVLQTVVMFAGVILTILIIGWRVGSIQAFFEPSLFVHWESIDFNIDATKRMTVGNIFIMTLVWQVCTAGSDQMAIQRYLSTANAKTASRSYKISLVSSCIIQLLLAIAGLTVMTYFTYFPEEMAEGTTIYKDADTLFPRFISIGLPIGITGLIAAAIMSAAMSSLSSGLNSSATVIQEDIINRGRKKETNQTSDLRIIKQISAVLGIIISFSCLLVAYVTGNLLDVVIKVVNLVVAPLFVLFFMALFVPFATNKGTVIGGVFSLLVAISIAFFELLNIKVLWIMPASLITGIIVASLFSYVETQLLTLKKKL